MISGGPATASLARDTVFAAVMLTVNGIMGGLSLFVGSRRYGSRCSMRRYRRGTGDRGVTGYLEPGAATFTTSRPGPEFSSAQLIFAAVASLVLYGMFVITQTGPHRHFFRPVIADEPVSVDDRNAAPPTAGWRA